MADIPNFSKLVPGFEFLQSLTKTAGSAMPTMGQWVAPTLNPEELEKRISELRTVQFWLETNAKMLGATIQALEVQRMTLSTLKTMNVQMGDLRDSLTIKPGSATPPAAAAGWPARPEPAESPAAGMGALPQAIDPMQWWGALTKQFTELATTAMKDSADKAAETMSVLRGSGEAAAASTTGAGAADASSATDPASEAARAARKSAARKTLR